MFDKFKNFLIQRDAIKPNQLSYYQKWVADCYVLLNVPDTTPISSEQRKQFLYELGEKHEDWQIKQADTALRLYNYFLSRESGEPASAEDSSSEWETFKEKMRNMLRLNHRAYSTEKHI